MSNLLSYCGLVDARISPSEKDLPVQAVGCRLDDSGFKSQSSHILFSKKEMEIERACVCRTVMLVIQYSAYNCLCIILFF